MTLLRSWEFEFYSSLPFWAALLASAAVVRWLGSSPRARALLLLATSNALLLAIPRFRLRDLLLVWLVGAVSFAAGRALQRPGGGIARRRWVAGAGIAAVLACLAFFKYHFLQDLVLGRDRVQPRPSDYLFLIGVSYFSFKAIHVVVESYKRSAEALDPLTYAAYLTFFPSFISGPINRYDGFAAELAREPKGTLGQDLRAGGERIVHGLFKKLVLVPLVLPYVLPGRDASLAHASAGDVVVGLYACALYFYLDFSGYSDLAIGGARVIGVGLPENFNHPFLQRNIRELWSNWHMSLTTWLVDYVYWPLVRKLRNVEFFRARPVLLSALGMNVTFIACGVWHGEAVNFVLWGEYHGMGISVLNVYQRQKRRIPSRWLQRYFQSRASRIVGALLTFHFFAAGLALFVLDLGGLRALVSALLR
jgi:alginate O-acetyltransferase complex protein AlgI